MLGTLERTNKWFSQYQPNLSNEEGQILYKKLIQEELDETNLALKENNLVEFLDGCIDLYWVIQGYKYFGGGDVDINPFEIMFNNINYVGGQLVQESLVYKLINAVADSNFTKTLELQTEGEKVGKVIKGPNFVPPTESIKEIIKNYNITFKGGQL